MPAMVRHSHPFRKSYSISKITNMEYSDAAPVFKLYGTLDEWPVAEMVHCETIATRSRLHNWHIHPHRHMGLYQVLSLHDGEASVWLDDARYQLVGPGALEIPQAFVHSYDFTADCSGHVLTLTYELLAQVMQQLGPEASIPEQPAVHRLDEAPAALDLHEACSQLQAQYSGAQPYREAQIRAWLTLLFARLRCQRASDAPHANHSRGFYHYARFAKLLEASHADRHDVAWYAARMGMSAAHLNVVTRAHAGQSPLQLIHQRLALEAGRSLLYSPLTIGQISDSLGFAESAHFTRFFRKMTGRSPRAFRQRAAGPEPAQRC